MTHPFRPWLGREFVSVGVRPTWGEDRVFYFDADGVQRSLPTGWTDAGDPDPFVLVAGGRCPFRVEDLLVLVELVEVLRRAVAMTVGKADSADHVGRFCRTSLVSAQERANMLSRAVQSSTLAPARALFSGEPPVGVSFRERRVRHRTDPPDLDLA